jgi:hypothetical protein
VCVLGEIHTTRRSPIMGGFGFSFCRGRRATRISVSSLEGGVMFLVERDSITTHEGILEVGRPHRDAAGNLIMRCLSSDQRRLASFTLFA